MLKSNHIKSAFIMYELYVRKHMESEAMSRGSCGNIWTAFRCSLMAPKKVDRISNLVSLTSSSQLSTWQINDIRYLSLCPTLISLSLKVDNGKLGRKKKPYDWLCGQWLCFTESDSTLNSLRHAFVVH